MVYFKCGGSSTLDGLTDVSILSPTDGQVLAYDATNQKWVNKAGGGGSGSRTYLGQLIPRVSAADSKITASTSNSSFNEWGAFNGTSPSDLRNPPSNSCWLAEPDLANQWIEYHFDVQRYFTKIVIACFSNYSSDWVGDIKVEGSADGLTWINILANGTTYELTAEYQTLTTVEINLDDTDLWEYIRVTFVDKMSVYYQPSCFIDEIYVYGGEEISGSSSAEEMTLAEYNALTTAQKNDGTIRFIPESSVGIINPIDMSNPTDISESSNIVITPSEESVEMTWDTSTSSGIAATFYYNQIDVTNYDYLVYDLVTGDSYDSLHPGSENPIRDLGIGLCSSAPSTWAYAPNVNWTVWNRYGVTDTNKNLGTQTLDVSELSGEYYLVIAGVAWEATISNLKYATSGGNESQIKYMNKTYGNTDVIELTQSEYNALPDGEKNNGCIYMVSSQTSTPEELTEAQTNTSTAVTASSYTYDTHFNQYHYPWCAFNRVSPDPNEMAYPTPGVTTQTCWSPNTSQDGSNSWICYHFDRAQKMTSMIINSFTDYDSSITKNMVVEGSNDGTTWTNILFTGNSFSLNSNLHTLTTNNVNLNSDIAYEYVRLRSLEPMGGSYQPSVFIDEIFVYGYKSEKALNKIYYMGTEYGNTGGGSSGGLTSEVLLNSLADSIGTYTLSDDYDNYDILEIYFCNPSMANRESDLITVFVKDVKSLMNDNKILNLTGYGDRYINCSFSGDEFEIAALATGGVQKIVGYRIGNGSSSSHTYSTTEQIVGTWIDGSDVYEKSYQISLPSSYDASNAWIVEADGSFIESILSFEGTIKTSGGLIMSAGSNAPGWHFTLHRNDNNQLVLQSGNGNQLMNGTAYIVIRYTKVSTS